MSVSRELPAGNEPVVLDGRPAGHAPSAAFGHTIGRPTACARPPATAVPGTSVEIEYVGRRIRDTVVAEPVVDPGMTRIRR